MVSLIISDIVGDPLNLIASAPTVLTSNADVSQSDPIGILKKLATWDNVPKNVQIALQESQKSQPPKVCNRNLALHQTYISFWPFEIGLYMLHRKKSAFFFCAAVMLTHCRRM